MAAHSSVFAWRIARTTEPAGYSPWDPKSQTRLRDETTTTLAGAAADREILDD